MPGTASPRRVYAAGPVLPEEIVVWDILVRLPAKSILICRSVCRSWRRLTSENAFLLAHHRLQPSLPLVTFHGQIPGVSFLDEFLDSSQRSDAVADASLDTLDLRQSPSSARQPVLCFNDYNYDHGFSIHYSCDGLVLLSLSDKDFYLCNPATRQWTVLPHLTGANGAVLYPHTSSGEYRVIYWKGRYSEDRIVIYHVITIGSSAEPRRIQAAATPHVKRLVEKGWLHIRYSPAVLLHGCLHWLLHFEVEQQLVVFDTVAESFRSMPSPIVAHLKSPQLLKMDGTLAVSWIDESKTMMKLWVLQDYETGVWSLNHQVILPVVEMWSIAKCEYNGTMVSEEGDMLLYNPYSFHLFHSDHKGQLLHKFCWPRVFPMPAGLWFRESLVRHQFFERQEDGDLERTQPRFFRGL